MPAPVNKWTFADLSEWLKAGATESNDTEFKSSAALANSDPARIELSKDISAFANSAGGQIFFGVKELPDKSFEPDGGLDPTKFKLEWLEQVINSRIRPKIHGINIFSITDPSSQRIYPVVQVPESGTAHQAHDKKYYRRFNLSAEPMEDYEVRATMGRRQRPLVTPRFGKYHAGASAGIPLIDLAIALTNTGSVRATDTKIVLDAPCQSIRGIRGFQYASSQYLDEHGILRTKFSYTMRASPLFPGDETDLSRAGAVYQLNSAWILETVKILPSLAITWTLFADDNEAVMGVLNFSDLNLADPVSQ